MTDASAVACDQEGCPFVEEGRCLEGLPNGEGCPHLRDAVEIASGPATAALSAEDADGEPASSDEFVAEADAAERLVELGGDESLSVVAADELAAAWGARVVLFAGEHNAGKTTLLAELYARFLTGPVGVWSFAGSQCLIAFDRRYHGARGPGGDEVDVGHTVDEGMRLLDLRVRDTTGRLVSLLLSDIQGEFVRQVIEGAPVGEDLPLAVRADRTAVVIDGDRVADPYSRYEAVMRAQVLIGALTDPGGLVPGRPLAVVLTKHDVLDEEATTWFIEQAKSLEAFARTRGAAATTTLLTAAQPKQEPHRGVGLDAFLAWLVQPDNEPAQSLGEPEPRSTERSFWLMGGVS